MKNRIVYILIVLIFVVTLAACNLPNAGGNANDPSVQQTSIAQTVEVLRTQLMVASTPEVSVTTSNPVDNLPIQPTLTSTVSLPTATITPSFTLGPTYTTAPTYKAGNIGDVTYVDNTQVTAGETFTKTWSITNTGTATWSSNFKIVFVDGDAMGGPASQPIGKAVAPGSTINVSVVLTAPSTAGTYTGNWMLQTEAGNNFGIGPNADGSFWVKVKVVKNFAVTAAVPTVAPATYTGACPVTMAITANITSTSDGSVTYYFKTSLGDSPTYTLSFGSAGTKTTAAYSLVVPATTALSVSVYIDNPNHQEFGAVVVPVNCVP